jgi:hypothetical protein
MDRFIADTNAHQSGPQCGCLILQLMISVADFGAAALALTWFIMRGCAQMWFRAHSICNILLVQPAGVARSTAICCNQEIHHHNFE